MKSNLELDGFNKQIEQFVWDDKNLLRNSCIKPAKGPDGNKKFGLKWTLKKHEKMKDAQSIDYICENLEDVTKLSTHQKLSCKATASEEITWILFSLIVLVTDVWWWSSKYCYWRSLKQRSERDFPKLHKHRRSAVSNILLILSFHKEDITFT